MMETSIADLLTDALRRRMLTVAKRYLKGSDEAEDVVQDSLLRLARQPQWKEDELLPMALTFTRNAAIDLLRKHQHSIFADVVAKDNRADARQADDLVLSQERQQRIETMLSSLPKMQQVVVRMRHIDELDNHEIARLTGLSEVAIRQHLSRARHKMIEQYKHLH